MIFRSPYSSLLHRFVKHYRTHLSPILSLATSNDGKSLAALALDSLGSITLPSGEIVAVKGSAKIFDVENFDMINILKLDYRPRVCCWVHGKGVARTMLAM